MKHYLIGAAALLALAACTTTDAEMDVEASKAVAEPEATMMTSEEEVCAIRDPDDGECLCKVANDNGECVQTGGVIIIPAPVETVRPTGGVVVIPDDGATPE